MNHGRSDFDADRMAVERMEARESARGFRYSPDNSFSEYEMKETEREEQNGTKNNNAKADA
jgi:hypothetical protein